MGDFSRFGENFLSDVDSVNVSNIITFSDKYEPLFDLLQAWDRKHESEYFRQLSEVHTVLVSGGRDSGKTFGVGMFNAIAVADYGHRILSTRYTLASTDNSIEKAQENRIEHLGLLNEFNITSKKFEHISNGGKIDIAGQKTSSGNQTAKMKSLEDYSIFITEEGEELISFEEWEKTTRSLRASDLQTISMIAFNPPTKAHWLYEKFYQTVPSGFNGIQDGVLYIHTTYLDNGKENMTETNWNKYEKKRIIYERVEALSKEERELCSKSDLYEWKDYKYTILGGFKEIADGVIYENWEIGEFNNEIPFLYGLDFGSNDPDALTKVAVDFGNRIIWIEEVYFRNNTSFDALSTILFDRCGTQSMIIADCAERRMITDLYNRGLNIVKSRKKDVSLRIKTIQGFKLVVTKNSLNLQTSLNNYRWHDKKSGIPNHDWSDLCDSFGYAVMETIQGGGNNILW